MLTLEAVIAGYGESQVLNGISFGVGAAQVVTLLGRNGIGKTTTVRAIMGLIRPSAGHIRFDGAEITGAAPYSIAQRGIGLVPEGRQIFPTLSVEENLVATAANRAGGTARWDLPAIYALFPRLAERRRQSGAKLSGGEQQMLAIGRALMTNPRLLVLDEATEGLAPLIRAEIWQVMAKLRAEGQAILLIDKNLAAVMRLADWHVVIEKGRVVWQGDSAALAAAPEIRDTYLHV